MKKKEYIDAINEIEVDNKMKKKVLENTKKTPINKKSYSILATAIVAFILAISIAIPLGINRNKSSLLESIEENGGLPRLGNFNKLYEILKNNESEYSRYYINSGVALDADISANSATSAASEVQKSESASESKNTDYSKTNVQVDGVDESDIVKTDGKYIYYITSEIVRIIDAQDSKDMKIVSEINYEDNDFYPEELYINGNKLIIIGEETIRPYRNLYIVNEFIDYSPSYESKTFTVAKVFNIEDKTNPEWEREVKIKGDYFSSRMIGDDIYFLANDRINSYVVYNKDIKDIDEDDFKPEYVDTAVSEDEVKIGFNDIYYFPESEDTSYLSVAGFNINNNNEANIQTYLGAGTEIYSSENNMYVTRVKTEYKNSRDYGYYDNYDINTYIYKFELKDARATYKAAGSVPGSVLNQFSMDEKDGYFRIATTDSTNWSSESNKNNMYVLNEDLEIVGRIENLAKGEKIYSVRFMGNRAYMVTFVQTDPLFVIDLTDPENPTLLGELKIPGYSKYLHPYDDTHIIGFGERTTTNEYGGVVTDGMKMALFDVTNPSKPKEMFSVNIGEKGTYSELLNNHKALLFSKEKNIIAFPVRISEKVETYTTKTKFQGAVVYELDLKKGFNLKGMISHLDNKDEYKAYDYDKQVERIINIKDSLFTLSKELVKSTSIKTMKEESSLELY